MTLKLEGTSEPYVPPARPAPAPYEVRIRFATGATVVFIGHDKHGHPMAELRVGERHASESLRVWMEAWCRETDPIDLGTVE